MSNYSSLKATINANVKANGNQEITGPVMNSVLNAMVDSLGTGYQYKGKAVPSTNPGTPDSKVYYLASEPGTYTNFNGIVVSEGEVAILKWDTAWSKEVTGAATAAQLTQLGQKVIEIGGKTPIIMESGYFYIANKNVGDVFTGSPTSSATYKRAKVACSEGDAFLLNIVASSGAGAIAFTDSDDILLSKVGGEITYTNEVVIAPANAAYIYFNDKSGSVSYRVGKLGLLEAEVDEKTKENADNLFSLQKKVTGEVPAQTIAGLYINEGVVAASASQTLEYIYVNAGDIVNVAVTATASGTIRRGFFANTPAIGQTATDFVTNNITPGLVGFTYSAQSNGFLAFSLGTIAIGSVEFIVNGSLSEKVDHNAYSIESLKADVEGKVALDMVSGYYNLGGLSVNTPLLDHINANANYRCGKAKCESGDIFTMNLTAGSGAGSYVFVDEGGIIIEKVAGTTLANAVITAPAGAAYLYFNDNSNSTSYRGSLDAIRRMDNFGSWADSFGLSQNSVKSLPMVYVRKDSCLSLMVGQFTSLMVGEGNGTYRGYWLEVDAINVKVYRYLTSSELVDTYAHNLDILAGVNLTIKSHNTTADIIIVDAYGSISRKENVTWEGGGSPFVKNLGASSISGKISFVAGNIDRNIWLFGDSYMSYGDSARWLYYMLQWGFDKWLANNHPGINSTNSLICFDNLIQKGKPQFCVWTLGMNDGGDDNATTPNATWLSKVESFIATCNERGIVPILATIPTAANDDSTDLRYNEGKNYWVRNSGYRYIDFALAVGANSNGTWRTGLKASDVHPSSLGAKVLASQVLVDFPEITH